MLVSSWYYADVVHTCGADRLRSPVLSARTIRSTCSEAVQRTGDVAQPALEEAGRGRAWTETRRAWSDMLGREGTACTTVVLQSQVRK